MPRAWSDRRERQYEHIKDGLRARGTKEAKAEEIAARTVNKERARSGEAKQRSRTSLLLHDIPKLVEWISTVMTLFAVRPASIAV